ncbi:uncharacterized protein PAC_18304 [Phialocephala subalpina]|uniref:Lysine-specific metallo-endopeptidase domain-containing protein n=1 Tax=Phialocephala subalpina TaxID=576137 RepID=A0A1L7XTS5_9HELO|nr:uncharacterized protein PAC_18304 [Phialocephala subalpina]
MFKMMFSLNSGLSIIWCHLHLILFLASLAPFTAAIPTKRLHNDTRITPRLAGEFRIMNCDSAQKAAINAALSEIVTITGIVSNRVLDLYDLMNVNGDPDFAAFTAIDQSTYDTFETVFGVELYSLGVNPLGIDALNVFNDICQKLYYGTSNIQGQSLDIWCGDSWQTTTNDQGDYYILADGSIDTDYLWDNSGSGLGWIIPHANIEGPYTCENPNTGDLAGYTGNRKSEDVSITTLCNEIIDRMIASGASLTSQAGTAYALNAISLDQIADNSLTLLLIHELTHTYALMGMDDVCHDYSYGEDLAYGWQGITALAAQSTADAIFNADSITFFMAAMYLSKNTWWTGLSMPLTDSAVYEEGITFQSQ